MEELHPQGTRRKPIGHGKGKQSLKMEKPGARDKPPPGPYKVWAAFLRRYLNELGISQKNVKEELGVDIGWYKRARNGWPLTAGYRLPFQGRVTAKWAEFLKKNPHREELSWPPYVKSSPEIANKGAGPVRPRELSPAHLAGVCRASTGSSRVEAYRKLSKKANRRLVVMGIGMTNISKYSLESLRQIAVRVPIDLLMLDPKVLQSEPKFTKKLEDFLGFPNFTASALGSYAILRKLCLKWNSQRNQKNKMRFRVYNTIPTLSMVMIDPMEKSGEIELEFFIYQAGEFRPRIAVKKIKHKENLFALLHEKFELLWKRSRRVVP